MTGNFRLAFAAAILALGFAGAAGTAQADPHWGHDGAGHDGGRHDGWRDHGWHDQGWHHDNDRRWGRDRWRGGWGGPGIYAQAPPPIYYAPPPPPPVYYAPPAYYAPPPGY